MDDHRNAVLEAMFLAYKASNAIGPGAMRDALLALAESELSEEFMDQILDEYKPDGIDRHRHERGHFRAMLRSIALPPASGERNAPPNAEEEA